MKEVIFYYIPTVLESVSGCLIHTCTQGTTEFRHAGTEGSSEVGPCGVPVWAAPALGSVDKSDDVSNTKGLAEHCKNTFHFSFAFGGLRLMVMIGWFWV